MGIINTKVKTSDLTAEQQKFVEDHRIDQNKDKAVSRDEIRAWSLKHEDDYLEVRPPREAEEAQRNWTVAGEIREKIDSSAWYNSRILKPIFAVPTTIAQLGIMLMLVNLFRASRD